MHPSVSPNIRLTKRRILQWAAQFPYAVVLDNCQQPIDTYGQYELLVGVGTDTAPTISDFDQLPTDLTQWIMGLIPYELKNKLEPSLYSKGPSLLDWPALALFVPEVVLAIPRGEQEVQCLWGSMPTIADTDHWATLSTPAINFQPLVTQAEYLTTIQRLRQHIKDGDCYEINLAQAFTAAGNVAEPAFIFDRLTQISPVPFAAFFKWQDQYIMCASPERFLQLKDRRLLTQPIKGTIVRGTNPQEDAQLKEQLAQSPKEQAENVMIVDLSRHDLHRSCEVGSVKVPTLFEIQTFPQVFQMVSTVVGRTKATITPPQVLANTFPPGSMTGAPKVKTMQLIDAYEPVSRGAYAGSIGYMQPGGNFDWNVIIRSLMYDATQQALHYHVGGAITYDSDPKAEYEETLAKAAAIRTLFAE